MLKTLLARLRDALRRRHPGLGIGLIIVAISITSATIAAIHPLKRLEIEPAHMLSEPELRRPKTEPAGIDAGTRPIPRDAPDTVDQPAGTDSDADVLQSEANQPLETRLAYASGSIATNLFDDGQEAGLSDALIARLVEIFGWDVDFALGVRPGDRFAVVYEERCWRGQKVADGQILAAEFVNQGRIIRAIAHRDTFGFTHYYTPDGMEMQRIFLRTPVKYTRISSRYTDIANRFNPILKRFTAHRGIDYAAPAGTPVRATATGRILAIGRDGGYGNRIILTHGGRYSTVYGHMLRFEPGLRVGSRVEQGQVIGYVGSTGLSTGPHLHYEFRVDDVHHDPLKFRFPGPQPMPAEYRADFLRDAATWVAKLDFVEGGTATAGGEPVTLSKIRNR